MSTDDEPATVDTTETTDASGTPSPRESSDSATDDTIAALRDIESKPLGERAQGYQELADRLRTELEHSDPSRGAS